MIRYDYIINNYYKNKNLHKTEEIDDKILYIASKYSNGYSKSMGLIGKDIEDRKEIYNKKNNRFSEAEKTFCDFRKKYDNAYKEYQTKLIQKIRIPLYVYSGKVIQNYPMGLGINISIKENQIIFTTDIKEDDIFNYLSMGQLNGVVLSIMLAVRSTLSFDEGLDLIMIDDPLQSIDDISAFSFADLLAESFTDSQIILSTHEEDKSNLFEFKFKQHGKTVKILNMHDKYIKEK
jgi:exonuclease SbcC